MLNERPANVPAVSKRILLVDDDRSILTLIQRHASDLGFSADLVAAGASDFISKPFEADELQAKIQRILRERVPFTELSQGKEKEELFFLRLAEKFINLMNGCRQGSPCLRYRIKDKEERPLNLLPDGSLFIDDNPKKSKTNKN